MWDYFKFIGAKSLATIAEQLTCHWLNNEKHEKLLKVTFCFFFLNLFKNVGRLFSGGKFTEVSVRRADGLGELFSSQALGEFFAGDKGCFLGINVTKSL